MNSNQENSSYLSRGSILMLSTFAGGFLVTYIFNVYLSNWLGPEHYGNYKVSEAYIGLGSLIVMLGGSRAVAKFLTTSISSGSLEGVWEYVRFYALLTIGISLGLAALLFILHEWHFPFLENGNYHPILIATFALPLVALSALFGGILQVAKRLDLAFMPWQIGYPGLRLIFCGLTVLIIGSLDDFQAVLLTLLSALLIASFVIWKTFNLQLIKIERQPDFIKPMQWLKITAPMMMIIALQTFMRQVDIYMLEYMDGEVAVGHFAAAITTAASINNIQSAMFGLLIPLTVPALQAGTQAIIEINRKGLLLMLKTIIPALILLYLFGHNFLEIFGHGSEVTYRTMITLALGLGGYAIFGLGAIWLQYSGKESWLMLNLTVTVLINSILNLLLIPIYSIEGAAMATAIAYIGSACITAIKLKQHLGIYPWTISSSTGPTSIPS
ncbi:polysaccharide biosynthesis C-terminal domain-containing protein [Parashewanella tropica]|uniref:oligosaccharide flippase family protein n=1 Tax=Parashewanella tropica TaxID=2547970 RepID=UPI0010599D77|nr:polysaccharide biosynthesis C-terminal domain-containing protein [Parashewanella tropica]